MAQGKYSPTVNKSYKQNQKWFEDYLDKKSLGMTDKEGYDSYGYDENGMDREGNQEDDYWFNDVLFEKVSDKWAAIPVIGSPEYLVYLKEESVRKTTAAVISENAHKVPEMLKLLEQVTNTFEGKTESEKALLESVRAVLAK